MTTSVRTRFCVSPQKHYDNLEPAGDTGIFYPVNSVVLSGDVAVRIMAEPLYEWVRNVCYVSYPVQEVSVNSLPATLTRAKD